MSIPRIRFRLRHLLIAMAVVAVVALALTRSWQRTVSRLDYISQSGAINGHVRTVQGYEVLTKRPFFTGTLFGDRAYSKIWLYPGTYDKADFAAIHDLFPEAKIMDFDLKEQEKPANPTR